MHTSRSIAMMKMYEIRAVAPAQGQEKRWFSNSEIQLYVYSKGASTDIAGFELEFTDDDLFIRYMNGALKVFGVDRMRLSTDLLTDTNRKLTAGMVEQFKEAASSLEPEIVSYVLSVLARRLEIGR